MNEKAEYRLKLLKITPKNEKILKESPLGFVNVNPADLNFELIPFALEKGFRNDFLFKVVSRLLNLAAYTHPLAVYKHKIYYISLIILHCDIFV